MANVNMRSNIGKRVTASPRNTNVALSKLSGNAGSEKVSFSIQSTPVVGKNRFSSLL